MKTSLCLFVGALCLVGCGPRQPEMPPAERTTVGVRFVHLFASSSGIAGPAVDIYRRWGLAGEDAMPIISGLAYGQVSEVVHPRNADVGGANFAFYNAGSHGHGTPFQAFTTTGVFRDNSFWTVHIVSTKDVSTSTSFTPAWNEREETPVESGAYPPVANSAKARVMINDIGINVFPNSGLYAGSAGACLKYAGSPSSDPDLVVTDKTVFDFDPGTFSIGLFANPASGPGNCTDAPLFGPASITGAAGSRTWLYLYGKSATDRQTLVLPFGG